MRILVKADMFENDFWVTRLLAVLAEDKENNCFQLAILNSIKFWDPMWSTSVFGKVLTLEFCCSGFRLLEWFKSTAVPKRTALHFFLDAWGGVWEDGQELSSHLQQNSERRQCLRKDSVVTLGFSICIAMGTDIASSFSDCRILRLPYLPRLGWVDKIHGIPCP